jgi:hypothetical protein
MIKRTKLRLLRMNIQRHNFVICMTMRQFTPFIKNQKFLPGKNRLLSPSNRKNRLFSLNNIKLKFELNLR